MDIIEMTRQLAKAIQEDDRYVAYNTALIASDSDEELQGMIGQFNMVRMNINQEMVKGAEKDQAKIDEMNTQINDLYDQIMSYPKMMVFNATKQEMDTLYKQINTIITGAINGENPDEIDASAGCTGDCSSCGGSCHGI